MIKELITLLSLIVLAGVITLFALYSEPRIALITLVVVLVAGLIYAIFFRAKYRFFRLAAFVCSGWISANAMPDLLASLNIGDNSGLLALQGSPGWVFNITSATLAAILSLCDLFASNDSFLKGTFARLSGLMQIQFTKSGMSAIVSTGDNSPVNLTVNQNTEKDFNALINSAAEFNKKEQPQIAIEKLQEIKNSHWDKLTHREKHRIHSNLAYSFVSLDEREDASRHFFKAYELQPEDEKGLAYRATAYLLMGDLENATKYAKETIASYPSCELANSVLIQADQTTNHTQQLYAKLPLPIQDSEEILLGLYIRSLHRHECEFCERISRKLLKHKSDSPRYLAYLGSCLINKAAQAKKAQLCLPEREVQSLLYEGIDNISKAIADKRFGTKKTQAEYRYHRAVGRCLQGERDLARADFIGAMDLYPEGREIAYQFGLFMIQNNEYEKALQTFEKCSELLGSKLMIAKLRLDRNHEGDLVRALETLEPAVDVKLALEERDRYEVAQVYSWLLLHIHGIDDAVEFLNGSPIVDQCSRNSLLAELHFENDDIEQAEAFAIQAKPRVLDCPASVVNLYLGRLFFDLEKYKDAIDVLKPICTPGHFAKENNLILECANRANDQKFILDFVPKLRKFGNSSPYATELEISVLEELNEFGRALEIISDEIDKSPDSFFAKTLRVRQSLIALAKERPELVESNESLLPTVDECKVELGCQVAQVLANGKQPIAGARFAYELLRQNFDHLEAHRCMAFLFGVDDEDFPEPEFGDSVAPGCAVKYRIENEPEENWFVIEDSPNPSITRNEIPPNHEISEELKGKKVGDEFYLRRNIIEDKKATITAICGKMRFRRWDSMLNSEKHFPGTTGQALGFNLKIPTLKNGEPDINNFLKMLGKMDNPIEDLNRLAKRLPITVSMFANQTASTVFEATMHYLTTPDLVIQACNGDGNEREKAKDAFIEHEAIVADSSALTVLYATNAFNDFTNLKNKRLITTERALLQFRSLLNKRSGLWAKLSSSTIKGKVTFIRRSDEDIEKSKALFENFIAWIESNFEIKGGIGQIDLPADFREEINRLFGIEALDTLGIVNTENALLWTDDIGLSAVANHRFPTPRVWTDLVLEELFENEQITLKRLIDLKFILVETGYRFVRLNERAFLRALELAEYNPQNYPLNIAIEWIHNSGINSAASLALTQLTLLHAWRVSTLGHHPLDISRSIIRSLRKRSDAKEILSLLKASLPDAFGINTVAVSSCSEVIDRELRLIDRRSVLILPGDPEWRDLY